MASVVDARTTAGIDTVAWVNVVDRTDARTPGPSPSTAMLRALTTIPGRRDDAVAIVNGLFGDALAERGSGLATPMSIRAGETILPLEPYLLPEALASSVPRVSSRICLLVHGLMSTESIWGFPQNASTTYGTLLADDHDLTVLSVRYNTGRHISTNGRELAELVDQLVRAWPVRVREINLIGHSMGGLVVRSACHYARTARSRARRLSFRRPWTSRVRRVVLIGVPNTGAGLEAIVDAASAALGAIPVPATRLIGLGLDRRSAGIKDLRFGAILDDDWLGDDPSARHHRPPHRAIVLRRAELLVIAGSVTADPHHPIAKLIGDALVTSSSANGIHDAGELFPGSTTRMFPKVTHNALAHHPDVYRAITNWW